jgi:glucokinase
MSASSNNFFAGVEVAPSLMRAAVVSADGEVVARREAAYQPDTFIADLAALVSTLREAGDIQRVGLAVPGLVNRDADRVLLSTGMPSFVAADLHAELTKAIGTRLELENDANAAAYGELHAGAARNARDFFYIYIGDNVGGAFIVNGKLWTGASGCAGEIGHTMINPDGIQCECGNIGCLETVASAPTIARRARER